MACDEKYDELASFAAGEADAERARLLGEHAARCQQCSSRLEALRRADAGLRMLRRTEPSARALLDTRRRLSQEIRGGEIPEIMTLDDVAEFLRIGPEEIEEVVEELPAFELAGRIRVRRERLIEWIEQRELQYLRRTAESRMTRIGWAASEKGA